MRSCTRNSIRTRGPQRIVCSQPLQYTTYRVRGRGCNLPWQERLKGICPSRIHDSHVSVLCCAGSPAATLLLAMVSRYFSNREDDLTAHSVSQTMVRSVRSGIKLYPCRPAKCQHAGPRLSRHIRSCSSLVSLSRTWMVSDRGTLLTSPRVSVFVTLHCRPSGAILCDPLRRIGQIVSGSSQVGLNTSSEAHATCISPSDGVTRQRGQGGQVKRRTRQTDKPSQNRSLIPEATISRSPCQ